MVGGKQAESRVTVVDNEIDGYRIVIANPRLWNTRIALGAWLAVWACLEVLAVLTLATGRPYMKSGPSPGLAFWLVGWTLGGLWVSAVWAWLWIGREVVVIGDDRLEWRREVAGLGLTSKYRLAEITNLRYDPLDRPSEPNVKSAYRKWKPLQGMGSVLFDCDLGTVDIGIRVGPVDAQLVIDAITRKIKPTKPIVG